MCIQQSEWHPGMRLPAVPELAQRFQVHRLTVLKALAGLKRTGWVQTVTGRGSFVSDHLPEAPALLDPENFPFQGSSLRVREDELGPWLGETLGRAPKRKQADPSRWNITTPEPPAIEPGNPAAQLPPAVMAAITDILSRAADDIPTGGYPAARGAKTAKRNGHKPEAAQPAPVPGALPEPPPAAV